MLRAYDALDTQVSADVGARKNSVELVSRDNHGTTLGTPLLVSVETIRFGRVLLVEVVQLARVEAEVVDVGVLRRGHTRLGETVAGCVNLKVDGVDLTTRVKSR